MNETAAYKQAVASLREALGTLEARPVAKLIAGCLSDRGVRSVLAPLAGWDRGVLSARFAESVTEDAAL